MKTLLLVLILGVLAAPMLAQAQPPPRDRIDDLAFRVDRLEGRLQSLAGPAFIAGILAALWAQNTRRNAWLWFFLGALFVPITLLVVLYLNARDLRQRQAILPPPQAIDPPCPT